ncbi:hypothetical protein, partial [Photobacterium kishitanii]|uniref:hypothetical protein n=1 Tax=Photobacterium kishitanii TaxID=318456 RepID=UPI000D4AA635
FKKNRAEDKDIDDIKLIDDFVINGRKRKNLSDIFNEAKRLYRMKYYRSRYFFVEYCKVIGVYNILRKLKKSIYE